MVQILLGVMILVGALMAIIAHETDNDALLWGMFGLFMPFFAVLFIPGMLDGRIVRVVGSDH